MTKGLVEVGYRNPLEEKVAQQLEAAGIKFKYEGLTLPVEIPARTAKAKPDFPLDGTPIILEVKGHFGGPKGKSDASAAARFKLILMKAQHPNLDIRFVFQNAKTKIYSGSKTTNGDWATDHGFLWSDRGIVPQEWLKEAKAIQRKGHTNANRTRSGAKRTSAAAARRTRNRSKANRHADHQRARHTHAVAARARVAGQRRRHRH